MVKRAYVATLIGLVACGYPALPKLTDDGGPGNDASVSDARSPDARSSDARLDDAAHSSDARRDDATQSDAGDSRDAHRVDATPAIDAGALASLTFGTATSLGASTAFRVADVDADGHLDIVSVSAATDVVSIFFGVGNGTFRSAVTFPTGHGPQSVAVTDLDGNGSLDLVVAVNGTPTLHDGSTELAGTGISVLLNQGSRTFASHVDYSGAPAAGPAWVATGDVDGDGNVDAIIACHNDGGDLPNSTNSIGIIFGAGGGTFDPTANQNFPGNTDGVSGVAIADFDGDTVDDIAYVSAGYFDGSTGASLIFGDKTRGFARKTNTYAGYVIYGLAIADIDNDGTPDIVAADINGMSISVYLDSMTGVLTPHDFVIGSPSGQPALADFNRDGFLDINVNGQIYTGDGTGLDWASPITVPFAVDANSPFGPRSAAVDLDGDQRVDLLAISGGNLTFSLSTAD